MSTPDGARINPKLAMHLRMRGSLSSSRVLKTQEAACQMCNFNSKKHLTCGIFMDPNKNK